MALRSRKFDTEIAEVMPTSLSYSVALATPQEKQFVISELRRLGRQTMNFRTMSTAQVILLKDSEHNDTIIGWQGLDYETNPKYPEKFSLNLDDRYRSFLLGLTLEHTFASILWQRGFKFAFTRMASVENRGLFEWRVKTGIFDVLRLQELDPEWVASCQKCELFKGPCSEQSYIRIDIQKLLEFGNRRLGIIDLAQMPRQVVLIKNESDQRQQVAQYSAHWKGAA